MVKPIGTSQENGSICISIPPIFERTLNTISISTTGQDGEETILDAMLLAISRFNCFKNYSHDELLDFYNRKGMPIINIWGEDMYHQYGILVKKPRAG